MLESGTNIRVVQKLLGHADVKTTEIYRGVIPFIMIQLVVLMLVIVYPEIVTWVGSK